MFRILKIIFCKHKDQKFVGYLYGDQAMMLCARKEFECKRCGCRIFK